MNKEEITPWIRNLIDSSIKTQDKYYKDIFYLCYNKQYVRALKLSTITGKPVNINEFNEGVILFGFDTKTKMFWYYSKIGNYLYENYSMDHNDRIILLQEVLNEYEECDDYKGYKGYKY